MSHAIPPSELFTPRRPPTMQPGRRASSAITVVLADAHPVTLHGLERLFSRENFVVAARCGDGEETIRAVLKHRPDILLIDLALPGKDALTVAKELRQDGVPTQIVLRATSPEADGIAEAIRLGVRGVVLKDMPSDLVVQCIRTVHRGELWIEERSVGRLLEKLVKREAAQRQLALDLTARELEIVRLVASGLRNKQIAARLFVKEGTIKIHLHNIYRKLNVDSRIVLTLYAQKKGFA